MDAVVILVPFLPLCAALLIAAGVSLGILTGDNGTQYSTDFAVGGIGLACLMATTLAIGDVFGKTSGYFSIGQWLGSDTLDIRINFVSAGYKVALAAGITGVLWVIGRLASTERHRASCGQRLFFILSLLAAALSIELLSANMIGTLAGWQLATWCAYLLVSDDYESPAASRHANRVLIAQQIGNSGFLIGISLCYIWLDNVNWARLDLASEELGIGQATGISLCFAWAAFAQSAQLPFTPWLGRAMHGPMPAASVVMCHTGIFLLGLVQPIFEQSPFALAILGIVGVLTALYSVVVGLTRTDPQSVLAYATTTQLGLMFLEAALGWWQLMAWHCGLHLLWRCWQSLAVEGWLSYGWLQRPFRVLPNLANLPIFAGIGQKSWAFTCALQGFWLEAVIDWAIVNPVRQMAQDLYYFDSQIIDRLMGSHEPAMNKLAGVAQHADRLDEASASGQGGEFAQGSGLAGKLAQWTAGMLHRLEEHLVSHGWGNNAAPRMRKLGRAANRFELVIIRPRYLVLFIGITFLLAF